MPPDEIRPPEDAGGLEFPLVSADDLIDLAVRRLADTLEPDHRAAILAIVAELADLPDTSALEAAIDARDLAAVMRIWEAHLASRLQIMVAIAVGTFGPSVEDAGTLISASFHLMSPGALDWVTNHSNRLVVGITADARQSLRTVLEAGYRQGMGAAKTARLMRSVVGLLPSHTAAVMRYTAHLRDQGFPPAVIERNANLYAARLLRHRTENIARTETITATSAGQMMGWQANIRSGVLEAHRTWVEWMVTEDDRLCPLCAPMDGQRVRVGEYFTSTHRGFPDGQPTARGPGSRRMARRHPIKPDPFAAPRDSHGRFTRIKKRNEILTELKVSATVPYPPLHPSCRCAMVLRFDP